MILEGTINWVLILVVLIFIFYALRGYKEGFVRTVFGMFSFIIALAVASVLGPDLAKIIKANDKVIPYITQKTDTENITLPKVIMESLTNQENAEKYKELAVDKAEDYMRVQLALWVINSLCFVLVFTITFVILWYICLTLNIISKLPVLNGLNRISGVIAGVLRGFITIWMWCIVLTIFSTSRPGQAIFSYINQNEFLEFIYNNNLLLEIGKIFL